MTENEIGGIIVDTAVLLHKKLGPGLFESVYEVILTKELAKRGLFVQRQVLTHVEFEEEHFEKGFYIDMIVDGKVIIELKSVKMLDAVHKKQLLTYMKMTRIKLGYILNFGAVLMRDGIVRMVNGL